jgi:hypothetical protein
MQRDANAPFSASFRWGEAMDGGFTEVDFVVGYDHVVVVGVALAV